MDEKSLTLHCEATAADFRRYVLFDTFRRRKRWISPAVFAAILCFSAVICFVFRDRAEGALLLCFILVLIGLGLPCVYFGNYLAVLGRQIKKLSAAGNAVYTVKLEPDGITMIRGQKSQYWPWGSILYVYRITGELCVYPNPQQAFLITGGKDAVSGAYACLRKFLPPEKLH